MQVNINPQDEMIIEKSSTYTLLFFANRLNSRQTIPWALSNVLHMCGLQERQISIFFQHLVQLLVDGVMRADVYLQLTTLSRCLSNIITTNALIENLEEFFLNIQRFYIKSSLNQFKLLLPSPWVRSTALTGMPRNPPASSGSICPSIAILAPA